MAGVYWHSGRITTVMICSGKRPPWPFRAFFSKEGLQTELSHPFKINPNHEPQTTLTGIVYSSATTAMFPWYSDKSRIGRSVI